MYLKILFNSTDYSTRQSAKNHECKLLRRSKRTTRLVRRERTPRSTGLPWLSGNQRRSRSHRPARTRWFTRFTGTDRHARFAGSSRSRRCVWTYRRARCTLRRATRLSYRYPSGQTQSKPNCAGLRAGAHQALGRIQYAVYGWRRESALPRLG